MSELILETGSNDIDQLGLTFNSCNNMFSTGQGQYSASPISPVQE